MAYPRIDPPSFIYLYDGANSRNLDMGEIVSYLKRFTQVMKVELRTEFWAHYLSVLSPERSRGMTRGLAEKIAVTRVRKLTSEGNDDKPMPAEVEYEERWLVNSREKPFGLLYDAFRLQPIYGSVIAREEQKLSRLHIIFTNQLLGTWDGKDRRYHARVSVYGLPSILSTTGVVEAPAKPKEFYLERRLGVDLHMLKEEYRGRFIDHDDARLTEVMKGYVMQALFFYLVGDPFCEDKNCRLYNAHWQDELIQAQLASHHEFCQRHKEMLRQLR